MCQFELAKQIKVVVLLKITFDFLANRKISISTFVCTIQKKLKTKWGEGVELARSLG